MRQALREDYRKGRLSPAAVQDLARVVGERELHQAEGKTGIQRVQQVGLCARELEDSLKKRAALHDAAAPWAALALLEVDRGDPATWRQLADSSDDGWRAVGVRTLDHRRYGGKRRAAMLDPDERVRRSAVLAALEARDTADRDMLLDVARNDPSRLVRVTAIRALGWVAIESDVLAMRDLWATAPQPVRQALVAAWSFPGTLERGGQRELIWVAETHAGTPSVMAGGILMRLGGQTRGIGVAALRKGMQAGIARDRAFAISMVPLSEPGILDLVKKLAEEAEPQVRVAALSKLATHPETGAEARKKLGEIAASDEPTADKAQQAMARLGDRRVLRLLLNKAKSSDLRIRQSALRGLLALGDTQRAAFFMADPNAALRTRAACELLAR